MNELPLAIHRSIRRYQPVEYDGLTLFPVLVKEYENFLIAQPALEVMHQSLPVAMMRIPLLSALYQMDFQDLISGKQPTGLFARARLALALSFRLGEGQTLERRIEMIQVIVNRTEPEKLVGLRFLDAEGTEHNISPAAYKTLREIIAAQNGVKIESDKANPAIVQAQKDMYAGKISLDANIDALISSIAALTGTDEASIEEWPILKLEKRSETYRRILDYIICGVGETNGASWKTGNPTPHPFFKRIQDGTGLFSVYSGGDPVTPPESVRQTIQNAKNF